MKDGSDFCEKEVHLDIFLFLIMTLGKKLKEFIVEGHVLDTKLLWFFQIRLQLAVIIPIKSGL
jgi:hypothetical protein